MKSSIVVLSPGLISPVEGHSSHESSNGIPKPSIASAESDAPDEDDSGKTYLRYFRNPYCYVVLVWICACVQGMSVNGFMGNAFSSIERRFGITSTDIGYIGSAYDAGFALLVIPVSYYGGKGHKPRYIGIGMLVLGIGSWLFALSEFLVGPYNEAGNASPEMCGNPRNNTPINTQSKVEFLSSAILANRFDVYSHDTCPQTTSNFASNYKYLFLAANFMHGCGATALFTLGVNYIDENVSPRLSPVLTGIFFTGFIIGTCLGFVIGGQTLELYTDISVDTSTLRITPISPKWVGAWWMGFLLSGTIGILVSLPLLVFPKSLPGAKLYASERECEVQFQGEHDDTGKSRSLKDMLLSIRLLLKNLTYMSMTISGAALGGFTAFNHYFTKYTENQFCLTPKNAAYYTGIVLAPTMGFAMFFGGFLVNKFDLKVTSILRLTLVCTCLMCLGTFSLTLNCGTKPFAGVSVLYGHTDTEHAPNPGEAKLNAPCNAGCECDERNYNPMCGANGVIYFSPCYGGCTSYDGTTRVMNCSCVRPIGQDAGGHELTGDLGKCIPPICTEFPIFLTLFGISVACVFLICIPSVVVTLRCMSEHQRSLGLGMQWIIIRVFGPIPAHPLFGHMFDVSCLTFAKTCPSSEKGNCLFYDNAAVSRNITILGLVFGSITIFGFILANLFYKTKITPAPADSVHISPTEDVDKMKEAYGEAAPEGSQCIDELQDEIMGSPELK